MAESKVKNECFVTIQGWMINELKLSGNDLLVYAIIYGFSQDGESKFDGSLQYLADWCGATKQGIQKNLKNLEEQGYIAKEVTIKNGIRFCSYSCIPYNLVVHPIQLSCINNIDNTIDNISLSKDKDTENPEPITKDNFFGSSNNTKEKVATKPKRLSLYDKCVQKNEEYAAGNAELLEVLNAYTSIRLAMKDKPLLGINQWVGMLNKLRPMNNQVEVVRQSIAHGWAMFYELKGAINTNGFRKQNSDVFSEYGKVKCDKKGGDDFVGDF